MSNDGADVARRAIGAADYHLLSARCYAPAIKRLKLTVGLARKQAALPQLIRSAVRHFQSTSEEVRKVTILEVLDTVVKVGLGALIGGLSTFVMESHRRRHEARREEVARYREKIEKPVESFVDDMLSFMSRAYWDRLDQKERPMGEELEAIRDREASVVARVFAMQDEALSTSFRKLDAAFVQFRQALGDGPLGAVRPLMHEVHRHAGDFLRRMYPRLRREGIHL